MIISWHMLIETYMRPYSYEEAPEYLNWTMTYFDCSKLSSLRLDSNLLRTLKWNIFFSSVCTSDSKSIELGWALRLATQVGYTVENNNFVFHTSYQTISSYLNIVLFEISHSIVVARRTTPVKCPRFESHSEALDLVF